MKRNALLFSLLLASFFFSFGKLHQLYAQTASGSATTPVVILPTLFPSVTPPSSTASAFPLLDRLDQIAAPAPPTVSSVSATPVASGSAQDYCITIPVVMYHHVEPIAIATQLGHPQLTEDSSYFDEHIKYLSENHYHFLSLGDLVHAILTRTKIPNKSIVITLDDGYIDQYSYAFLTAKKYHALMNFMIPTGLIGQPDYMTWDHLKEMAQSPYARIYNHTTTHAPLGLIDQSEVIKEVSTANDDLKNNLGIDNNIVIYPYGSYSDLAIQTLQQLGMIAAVSTDPGTNECLSNIYKLPRVRVGNEPIEEYGY